MTTLARIAGPAVSLLEVSTKAVFWLLRLKPHRQSTVSEEEIKMLIAEAESVGVLESGEHRMISGVLRLGDRPIRGLMTPRTEVDWIDVTQPPDRVRDTILGTQHSRVPVGEGSPDALIGVVRTREPLAALATGRPLDVKTFVQKAPIIPDTTDALDALEILRQADVPMALIHDEYGHFEGLVTPADILAAIAGVFRSDSACRRTTGCTEGRWFLAACRLDAGR